MLVVVFVVIVAEIWEDKCRMAVAFNLEKTERSRKKELTYNRLQYSVTSRVNF